MRPFLVRQHRQPKSIKSFNGKRETPLLLSPSKAEEKQSNELSRSRVLSASQRPHTTIKFAVRKSSYYSGRDSNRARHWVLNVCRSTRRECKHKFVGKGEVPSHQESLGIGGQHGSESQSPGLRRRRFHRTGGVSPLSHPTAIVSPPRAGSPARRCLHTNWPTPASGCKRS